MAKYRILSLDGGGIRGLLTLVLMQRLEAAAPGWLEQTDLIAGTSTGGIIAIGLAAGLNTAALRLLYQEHCHEVFEDSLIDDILDLGMLSGAEYDGRHLARLLHTTLGDVTLGQLGKKVVISAFDLDNEAAAPALRTWKAKFFHNFDGPDSDGAVSAHRVALYTSLAPTYFPAVDGYIDGGVVANNPSLAALAQTQDERLEVPGRPALEEIVLLSLGTGVLPQYIAGDVLDWGLLQWARNLVPLMLDGGNEVASYQCRQLLGGRFERLSPLLGARIELDDCGAMGRLVRIAERADIGRTAAWLQAHWLPDDA